VYTREETGVVLIYNSSVLSS